MSEAIGEMTIQIMTIYSNFINDNFFYELAKPAVF